MDKFWHFKIFDIKEFREWKKGLPSGDQAKIDLFISRLELIQNLPTKLVKPVKGYRKIFEIRIKGKNIVYRPLGCYGPEREQFTILYPDAIEKGGKFVPGDAPQRALGRRENIRGPLADYE